MHSRTTRCQLFVPRTRLLKSSARAHVRYWHLADCKQPRLAEQGYVEGKNLIIEQRFADCQYDRMAGLAADLVRVPVDVIFTMGTRAARIAAQTVKTTPLVVYSCDPYLHVKNLARPEGNLTGVTCMTTEMMPKRLELLHEAIPTISRVMFLHDPEAAPNAFNLTQEVAPRLGMTMQAAHVTAAEDLLPELAMIAKERPEALLVYPGAQNPQLTPNKRAISSLYVDDLHPVCATAGGIAVGLAEFPGGLVDLVDRKAIGLFA